MRDSTDLAFVHIWNKKRERGLEGIYRIPGVPGLVGVRAFKQIQRYIQAGRDPPLLLNPDAVPIYTFGRRI